MLPHSIRTFAPALLGVVALAGAGAHRVQAPPARVLGFTHARWLTAAGFVPGTRYVVAGRLTDRRPARVDSMIDLGGSYVVPPFGEAHNHNLEFSTPARTDSVIRRYLERGVFYVKNPGILPRARAPLVGRVNVPAGVDAVFSNGLLTPTGGHPSDLYNRNRQRGAMTEADGDGAFLWIIDGRDDLDRKWGRILAGRPDFIKTVLSHSEAWEARRSDPAFAGWRGLDPALLPLIVRRAHAARLRVSTHVETAADFHHALAAGVDEINHMPGFRGDEHGLLPDPAPYEIAAADAALAARGGVVVVTTLRGMARLDPAGADSALRRRFDALHARNLRLLRSAGAHLALGSDNYRGDSSEEFRYLAGLGVFTPLELLRLWSQATPRAIFPRRRVGCLENGCEASFLALSADPTADLARVGSIRLRVKDGAILTLEPPSR